MQDMVFFILYSRPCYSNTLYLQINYISTAIFKKNYYFDSYRGFRLTVLFLTLKGIVMRMVRRKMLFSIGVERKYCKYRIDDKDSSKFFLPSAPILYSMASERERHSWRLRIRLMLG